MIGYDYRTVILSGELSSARRTISRLRDELAEVKEAFEVYTGAGPYRSPGRLIGRSDGPAVVSCNCPCTGRERAYDEPLTGCTLS